MAIHRMPYGFGPTPGPRQRPDGGRWDAWQREASLYKTSFLSERAAVQSLLPPGFRVGEEARVTIRSHAVRDIPWLGGRGYNYLEVMFDVVYGDEHEVAGDFAAVMWESLMEPVLPGREEAGHPKIYADVTDAENTSDGATVTASWDGFVFAQMTLEGFDASADHPPAEDATTAPGRPRLNYRYFPRPGALDTPEIAEVVMIRPITANQRIVSRWDGTARVEFFPGSFEQLPSMSHIVEKLAALPVVDREPAVALRTVGEFDDCIDGTSILDPSGAPVD